MINNSTAGEIFASREIPLLPVKDLQHPTATSVTMRPVAVTSVLVARYRFRFVVPLRLPKTGAIHGDRPM